MAQHPLSRPAHCQWCPQDWDQPPEASVACPTCQAKPGRPCMRPSEHTAWNFHPKRQLAALDHGSIDKKICRGLCLPTKPAVQRCEAVLKRLRQQYTGRDTVPWEAIYAAVTAVVMSSPKGQEKKQASSSASHSRWTQLALTPPSQVESETPPPHEPEFGDR